jgi:hypothetical protein
MSLDISTAAAPSLGLSFEDDGYYWFLELGFRGVAQRTGKYVDLYGHTIFDSDAALADLEQALSAALKAVQDQPDQWRVPTAMQQPLKLQATVSKAKMIERITLFLMMCAEARRAGSSIECIGD